MNTLIECRVLAIIVIFVLGLSMSLFENGNAFSQTINNASGIDNSTANYKTPIDLNSAVKNSTESMKTDLNDVYKFVQNGDIYNTIKKINELNDSLSALCVCATSQGNGYNLTSN